MAPRIGFATVAAIFFAVIFLLLLADDALVWAEEGIVPGIEFFALGVLALAAIYVGLRAMTSHRPRQ